MATIIQVTMAEFSQERVAFSFVVEPDKADWKMPWQGIEGLNRIITLCGHHKLLKARPGLAAFMRDAALQFRDHCEIVVRNQPNVRRWTRHLIYNVSFCFVNGESILRK